MEWCWQGKPKVIGEKPVRMTLCGEQIANDLNRNQNRASTMKVGPEQGLKRLKSLSLLRKETVLTSQRIKYTLL
jgi:hypothetical protein